MGFQDDYVMRTISDLVRAIARLTLGKPDCDFSLAEDAKENEDALHRLYRKMTDLAEDGQINEAENLLFEDVDTENKEYLNMALSFYQYLNEFKDDDLLTANYSREEIVDGINAVSREFGVSGFEHFVDTTLV